MKTGFIDDVPFDNEIYAQNADGSGLTRLTKNRSNDCGPLWSPDGNKILFGSSRDLNEEVYVMNSDGSAETNLSKDPNDDGAFTWSPDGKKILFIHHQKIGTFDYDIYVINADGTALTDLTNNPIHEDDPNWSPDGNKVAYECDYDVCIMTPDGTKQTNLTNTPQFYESLPTWSPDGKKIAFYGERDPINAPTDVYVMNANGGGQANLTDHSVSAEIVESLDGVPWSPDGQQIAFESVDWEIYLINVDNSEVKRLTDDPLMDKWPAWSPAGSRLAFEINRDAHDWEIYIMNFDVAD